MYPKVIVVEPTTRCILECVDCPTGNGMTKKQDLGLEAFQELVSDIKSYCVVRFAGFGEPMLWPHLPSALALLRHKGVKTSVITSGWLLSENNVRMLQDVGLDEIEVSIDAVMPSLYEEARGGSLSNVHDGFRKLIAEFRGNVLVSMVDRWPHKEESLRFQAIYAPVVGKDNVIIRRHMPFVEGRFRGPCPEKRWPCPQLWERITLSADGTYRFCCSDWEGKTQVGTGPISALWHGALYQALRTKHDAGEISDVPLCADCEMWPSCRRDDKSYAAREGKENG